ncbi:MAG: amidohydrolase family protein [Deltaproteobacteria bacterium]|nr:amidohydrolase family protein [Deltaproteobacteria bacterium]
MKLLGLVSLGVALAALLALAQGCDRAHRVRPDGAAEKSATAVSDDLPTIDAHTHTEFENHPEPVSAIPMTQDEYFRQLKEANVVGAIAHTHQGKNDYFDLRARGITHCVGVGASPDLKDAENGFKSGKYGCIKIYLGYVHQWASDRHYQPLYKLAEKYDVAVVFHTGDTYSTKGKLKYADPLTIDEVAVEHPKVRFVIAHCGNPWIESAAEVAYKNPNVYLDASAFMIGNLDKQPQEKIDEYVVKPLRWIFGYLEDPNKLMFGSDWPLTYIATYKRAVQRAIPREHWKAVFHDNAVRVFKLKPAPGPLQ